MPLCLPRLAAVSRAALNRKEEMGFVSFQSRSELAMARFRELTGIPTTTVPKASRVTPKGNLAFGRPEASFHCEDPSGGGFPS